MEQEKKMNVVWEESESKSNEKKRNTNKIWTPPPPPLIKQTHHDERYRTLGPIPDCLWLESRSGLRTNPGHVVKAGQNLKSLFTITL
jgi:hypothetical protein